MNGDITARAAWPSGDGEMAVRIRAFPWAATPLGPIDGWPMSLRTAVDLTLGSPVATILLWGPAHTQVYNDRWRDLMGDKHPAALGQPSHDCFPEIADTMAPLYDRVRQGEAVILQDALLPVGRQGGVQEAWWNVHYLPVRDEDGAVAGILCTVMEATASVLAERERVAAVAAQRASEERLGTLVGLLPAGVYTCDAEGRLTFFNRRAAELWGREPRLGEEQEKFCGSFRMWKPEGPPLRHEDCPMADAVREGRSARNLEVVIEQPTGRRIVVTVNIDPLYDRDGRIAGAINVFVDVTESKRAAEAVREREADLARVQRIGQVGGMDIDVAGGLHSVRSPEYLRLHGLPPGARVETHEDWRRRVHPDDRDQAERTLLQALNGPGGSYDGEYRIIRPSDGEVRWIHARADIERDPDGKPLRLVGAHLDVTEWKRSQEALRESEGRYRGLFEAIDQGFCIIEVLFDSDGAASDYRFLEVNPAFERQTGLVDAVGKRMRDLAPAHEAHWFETYGRIALTGQPARFEHRADALGRWYEVYAFRIGRPEERRVGLLFNDIIERKRAEIGRREREERQAFLLKLSDALRAEPTEQAIASRVVDLLAEELGLDHCYVTHMDMPEDRADLIHQFHRPDLCPVPATLQMSEFPAVLSEALDRTMVFDDVACDPRLTGRDRRSLRAMSFGALLASPVRRGEANPIWCLAAAMVEPRHWTAGEIALMEDVAERTWTAMEKARAEAALRESEGRFRQFAEASAGALWIRDAKTLEIEYVSPAISTIYGVGPDAFPGDLKHWAAAIVPEDRTAALEHIERSRRGESAVHEFRIQRPSDQAFRWIRDIGFPLRDEYGEVQRIGGIAEDITEAKLSVEHQGVLMAELQHRVRNIMAMIQAIVRRTGQGAKSVKDYTGLVTGRLMTLARVQVLLTRAANVGVGIATIAHNEIAAQARDAGQYTITGPDVVLPPKAAEVLTLALHELATNALKYGALASSGGHIDVSWRMVDKGGARWLSLDWKERGAALAPRGKAASSEPPRKGFGSELIEARIPYELGGVGQIEIGADGAHCHLEFPLEDAASILETDAPQRATVFGGALDMRGEADLGGHRVLVAEDDYYLAVDVARALRGAGAVVLGPCKTAKVALDMMRADAPTAAVIDINLGDGPSFRLAGELKRNGIPFIFLTGYDLQTIPPAFADVPHLQKPVELRHIVQVLAELPASGGGPARAHSA